MGATEVSALVIGAHVAALVLQLIAMFCWLIAAKLMDGTKLAPKVGDEAYPFLVAGLVLALLAWGLGVAT